MKTEILRLECISKMFGNKYILNNVSLNVFKGEVLALIGANGAGKSTLVNILGGIYPKDGGKIILNETEVDIRQPIDSLKLGISIVYENPECIPYLSVADNIFLGKEIRGCSFIIKEKMIHKSAALLMDKVGLKVRPDVLAGNLSIAQKQMMEIAKALSNNSSLIVMDEPTSSLTEKKAEDLIKTILKLKEAGVSIIFVSQNLDEVLQVADRITVLKYGFCMGTYPKNQCDKKRLISLMVSHDTKYTPNEFPHDKGEEILRVDNLSTKGILRNMNFVLRRGEILGIAGLISSGRTELMKVLFGIMPIKSGTISINGKKVVLRKPADAIKKKIGFVPEDRKQMGLISGFSIKENITLSSAKKMSYFGVISSSMENFVAKHYCKKYSIDSSDINTKIEKLSAGNQQKILFAKWILTKPEILILDEPTKGMDIKAKDEMYRIIRKLAEEGKGILLVSTDHRELLALCSRIIVIQKGMIKGELLTKNATEEDILALSF